MMSVTEGAVRASFLEQAALCESFGSPFTARVIRALHDKLDRSTITGRAILDWAGPPGAIGDAVALRIAGALHAAVRANRAPALRAAYALTSGVTDSELWCLVGQAVRDLDASLRPWLDHAPQTNEVGRSVALYAGLIEVARQTRLPLDLYEIGSSAGLNLVLDRYRYEIGGRIHGDPDARLTLRPSWIGPGLPPWVPLIRNRRGCDVSPICLTDPVARERLRAYVWPDQQDRLDRLSVAIDILLSEPPQIDTDDAVAWVNEMISTDRQPGAAVVLMHSLTFCYLSDAGQSAIRSHMERAGALVNEECPLAWVAYELGGDNVTRLSLQLWPHGVKQVLAEGHPHCRTMTWLGP